jgi:hypothetical protein
MNKTSAAAIDAIAPVISVLPVWQLDRLALQLMKTIRQEPNLAICYPRMTPR